MILRFFLDKISLSNFLYFIYTFLYILDSIYAINQLITTNY
nr:MAG TPA: hypothetical protein [Caudoviricetes sp.]